MTLRPEVEALLQGAIDHTLTNSEREQLDRLMQESLEVRGRAAHLKQLTELLDSLGPAEPPAGLAESVLDRISASRVKAPSARVAAFPRSRSAHPSPTGVAINRKIMFGLATAAVLILAVVTFNNRPASEGTEATIGAAQRYQAPQIEAKDVAVGDTSAQGVLQNETWDAIVKDDVLRNALQDDNLREMLGNPDLRQVLAHPDILRALTDRDLTRQLNTPDFVRMLKRTELRKLDESMLRQLENANLRKALEHQAFVEALRNDRFRMQMARADVAAALSRSAFQNAIRDKGFDTALRHQNFVTALRDGVSLQ